MNPATPCPTEFAAFVALDWADQKHAWALQAPGPGRVQHGEVENTPEAIEVWASELEQRFGGRPLAVALEQPRGAVVAVLSKYAHLVLFPVHPSTLAHYRQCFYPSGAKSDPSDADLLLELLVQHRERLRPLKPDTVQTRLLQFLVEERRRLVDDRTRYSNRLTAWRKQVFPQVLQWFDDVTCPLGGDLLQRWPSLTELQRAKPDTLRRFFQEHNCRDQERIEERLRLLPQAVPATHDPALLEAGSLALRSFVRVIAQLREGITRYEQRIEEVAQAHPDFPLMDSFPGAGRALAPRLIAALGTDRSRFQSAQELQCYTGIAPVLAASGQQRWVHSRWACPKFVRQTIHEWALHSMAKCDWARDYYQAHRSCGRSHHTAVRALGFKWLRILFRCWQDRTPYQEEIYLQARGRQASRDAAGTARPPAHPPTPERAAASSAAPPATTSAVQLQWESVAGFLKLGVVTS
jgi:transposase